MVNRETGKTYKQSPMGGTPSPAKDNLMRKNILPSKTEELVDRLVTAYNSRAMANPNAPLLARGKGVVEPLNDVGYRTSNVSVEDRNGDRLGFASRDVSPYKATYNIANDLGNPDRGVFDVTLNTPLGNFSRGYEQETDYASYSTPSGRNGLDLYYSNGGNPVDISFGAGMGTDDVSGGRNFFVDANMPIQNDRYGSLNTPLGDLSYGTSSGLPGKNGYAYADYTPNEQMQYYIQALANLLNR